MAILTLSYL